VRGYAGFRPVADLQGQNFIARKQSLGDGNCYTTPNGGPVRNIRSKMET